MQVRSSVVYDSAGEISTEKTPARGRVVQAGVCVGIAGEGVRVGVAAGVLVGVEVGIGVRVLVGVGVGMKVGVGAGTGGGMLLPGEGLVTSCQSFLLFVSTPATFLLKL